MRKMSAAKEDGYIYFNALLDLVLVASLMPLIILFYLQMASYMEDLDASSMEWRLFTADLQTYLTAVDSIQLIGEGSGFRVVQQGVIYDVEVSGSVIRKQRSGLGHEIMLTDVSTCLFEIDGSVLKITLHRLDGTEERTEYAITDP